MATFSAHAASHPSPSPKGAI